MYKLTLLLSIAMVLALLGLSEGKIFEKCDFVNHLRKHGVSSNLGTWTCIAHHESGFNTEARNYQTGDHGILQISELYWCDLNGAGKGCNAHCDQFRDHQIGDDIECAKKIFDEHQRLFGNGFQAWTVSHKCVGNNEHWLDGC